jgi:hypothetical protein
MRSVDLTRACEAAREIVASLGLRVDEVIVLQNSNKLTLRLLPCDVVARVSDVGHEHADFELELASRLLDSGCPVAAPEPRGRRRGHRIDGFEISLWTYHETATAPITPVAYAAALERLHSGMASVDARVPHVTDRIAGAERLVTNPILTPSLTPYDRLLLVTTLEQSRRALRDFGAPEQLLHGEPHPGNLIGTAEGPVFIDLETCCRGPVEFDLAHVPFFASGHYHGVSPVLLDQCRRLVLAMVAAWRWDRRDELPHGEAHGRSLTTALRGGSPWPTVDEVLRRRDAPQAGSI